MFDRTEDGCRTGLCHKSSKSGAALSHSPAQTLTHCRHHSSKTQEAKLMRPELKRRSLSVCSGGSFLPRPHFLRSKSRWKTKTEQSSMSQNRLIQELASFSFDCSVKHLPRDYIEQTAVWRSIRSIQPERKHERADTQKHKFTYRFQVSEAVHLQMLFLIKANLVTNLSHCLWFSSTAERGRKYFLSLFYKVLQK